MPGPRGGIEDHGKSIYNTVIESIDNTVIESIDNTVMFELKLNYIICI